jgi:hypothetical protein
VTQTAKPASRDTWYTRIPYRDRLAVDAVSEWLRPIRWQWFVPLTFHWNVRAETADKRLRRWINLVERAVGNRMCFVAGMERVPSRDGIVVPWHYHLLVTAVPDLPNDLLENAWLDLNRLSKAKDEDDEHEDDSVLVRSYKRHSMGPEYCLKKMNDCHGDWLFRWLELFLPHQKQSSFPNARKIRQRKRFLQQRKVMKPRIGSG